MRPAAAGQRAGHVLPDPLPCTRRRFAAAASQGYPVLMTVTTGWQGDASARRYARTRFRTPRAAERDQKLVARLLSRHVAGEIAFVLDAPCGTGRLRAALARSAATYVGVDVSRAMLAAAGGGSRKAVADVTSLPFADDTFDVVVCCRLLHHLHGGAERTALVRELVRVARQFVIASFFDAASWQAWRRRLGLAPGGRSRRAVPKRVMHDAFASAGARVVGFAHSFRFVSQQVFLIAEKHDRVPR
ncbi:MAG: class I SAM-dependent methyltransferase [Planctomycetota bacterium]